MELVQMLQQASIVALLSMFLSTLPLYAGLYYLLKPSEQRLALMRPVSLAGLFAALMGMILGFINVLRYYAVNETPNDHRIVALGLAESMVPLFLGFGCLTIAWLCVAVGFRRTAA
jgi:hypothetical protein